MVKNVRHFCVSIIATFVGCWFMGCVELRCSMLKYIGEFGYYSLKSNKNIPCYGGPQVQYSTDMHIDALPSCFSSLLGTFRLFQAIFCCAERFFCYAKHCSSIMRSFSALPSSFQLCWALFCSANHFSSVLSTSRLCQAFFGYAKHFPALPRCYQAFFFYTERLFHSAKDFSSMLNIFLSCQTFFFYAERAFFSALPSIFPLCWALFCSAKHFSSMPCSTQQNRKIHGRAGKKKHLEKKKNARKSRKFKCSAWQKNAWKSRNTSQHRREMIGRAEKCLAWPKNARKSWEVLSTEDKCLAEQKWLGIAEKCLVWQKKHSAWPRNAWKSRQVPRREETQLGRAAMCI